MGIKQNLFIAGLTDQGLGEKIVLVIENTEPIKILERINWINYMNPYEKPRAIYYLPEFVLTPTGKINRLASLRDLKESNKSIR